LLFDGDAFCEMLCFQVRKERERGSSALGVGVKEELIVRRYTHILCKSTVS